MDASIDDFHFLYSVTKEEECKYTHEFTKFDA